MSAVAASPAWTGWDLILAGPRPRRPHRLARIMSGMLMGAGAALLALAPLIGCWPLVEQTVNRHVQAEQAAEVISMNWPQTDTDRGMLEESRAYNADLLASGQPVLGETVDPFTGDASGDFTGEDDPAYMGQLNDDQGIMAVIEVPSIGVDMPVRHGSGTYALEHGAGHLHGTSLPVGGQGSHSVITAHRGLRDKLMFTRLDELEAGDLMYVRVEGETLAYKVDRVSVIDPDDTRLLRARPGEDRLTLMTCTPYGVNTQRLLVSGVRAEIPFEAPPPDQAPGDRRDAILAGVAAMSATMVTGTAGVIAASRRHGRGGHAPRHAN